MKKQKKWKKLIASIFVAGSICLALPFSVSAAATTPDSFSQETSEILIDEYVEYLEDGSYLTTQTYQSPQLSRASTYQTTGRKVLTFSDSNGKTLWQYALAATFTVNPGVSATCTICVGTPTIYDNSWSVVSNKPSRSGNKATGTITMQKKVLGTVAQTVTKSISITCDANGNFS